MSGRGKQGRGSGAALALIALALWLRLLVPAGWMPTETGFGIRPCTPPTAGPAMPQGHHAGHHADHQGKHDSGPQEGTHQVCAFTALGLALDTPPQPILIAEIRPAPSLLAVLPLRSVSTAPGLSAPPPPATGPPA